MASHFNMDEGQRMSPYIEGLVAKYGAVLLGVGAGTAAKYRLSMGEGRKITFVEVASDLLLVPMIVLLAAYAGQKLGADSATQAVIAAFMAVSADRLIRSLRERFLQRVDAEFQQQVAHHTGMIREVVQTEMSGKELIDDQMAGRAPAEYAALKTKRTK